MKIEGVVVDASPLIILSRARLADLLPQLFPEVLIPGAVWDEVAAGGKIPLLICHPEPAVAGERPACRREG